MGGSRGDDRCPNTSFHLKKSQVAIGSLEILVGTSLEKSFDCFSNEARAALWKIRYNQAITNLAFHSNETSKDKLSII